MELEKENKTSAQDSSSDINAICFAPKVWER
jgi:flagellar biosynthesis regulator FlaF